jgi:Mrp family chromosome partitioning ATPase/capsular polysaccharide biosynthesis protein
LSTDTSGATASSAGTGDLRWRPPLLAAALRRRWTLIAGTTAICIITAVALGQAQRKSYVADTTVIVYPVAGTPYAQQSQGNQLVDLSTEAQVVRSDKVARLAQQQLVTEGYEKLTTAGLISRVRATVETNTQVLRISYEAGAARRARDGADAFAAAYLAYRQTQAKDAAKNGLAAIAATRIAAEHALELDQRILAGTPPASTEAGRIKAEIKLTQGSLADLRAQEADLTNRSVLPGEVLSPATLPSKPHGTSPPILGALGLLAGLVLGIVVAALRERAVGPIRSAAALPGDPPVLAVVPPLRNVSEPLLLSKPEARAAEAYRLLYIAVDASLPLGSDRGTVIVVASLSDPAPPVAINLAAAAASAGRLTTYVHALPRQSAPRLPSLGVDLEAPGFAEALLSGSDPVAARRHAAARLSVLTPGADIGQAAASYGGPRTQRVLDALRQASDLVVVAAPPLTEPDGQALASVADGVIVVVPIGTATFDQVDAAVTEARRVHARVLGVVATHPASGSAPLSTPPPNAQSNIVDGDERRPTPAGWAPS